MIVNIFLIVVLFALLGAACYVIITSAIETARRGVIHDVNDRRQIRLRQEASDQRRREIEERHVARMKGLQERGTSA